MRYTHLKVNKGKSNSLLSKRFFGGTRFFVGMVGVAERLEEEPGSDWQVSLLEHDNEGTLDQRV